MLTDQHITVLHDEVTAVDRAAKTVTLADGRQLDYTKLYLATGSSSFVPPIEGRDLQGVMTLRGLPDAERIREHLAAQKTKHIVFIGAGFISMEAATLLDEQHPGAYTITIVELMDRPLPLMLDADMSAVVRTYLEDKGLQFRTGEQVERIMRGLGLKTAANELELFIPGVHVDAARQRLGERIGEEVGVVPLIGFNPGAAFGPAKRWPAERYAELADRLSERTGGWILVFGSAADQPTATEILDRARSRQRIVDLTGRTSLVEAMALIGECDVFVTNDSGLMHVAAALHTPQVAIFGSTDHIRTGPYSEQAVIVRKELPCSPCKKPRCPEKHFRCMRLITSDEVFAAVIRLLEEG